MSGLSSFAECIDGLLYLFSVLIPPQERNPTAAAARAQIHAAKIVPWTEVAFNWVGLRFIVFSDVTVEPKELVLYRSAKIAGIVHPLTILGQAARPWIQ